MKLPFFFFLLLHLPVSIFAQTEKANPFERIVAGMKGVDTFMVYGDFCSGCIRGTEQRIHVLWKRKGVVWLRSIEYWYRFENVVRTKAVPYPNDPFAFYEVNKKALDYSIENSELQRLDTTVVGDGRILVSTGISHGAVQRIFIHYPSQTSETTFCCGVFEQYEKKAPLLVSFFSHFPKEVNPDQSFSDEIGAYSPTQ